MSDVAPMTACPEAATLRALLDGTLPEDQQAATQAHVDRCPSCEAALRQMTAGGESWIGMAEKLKGENEDDPKLAAVMERLKSDDGSGGEPSESADSQRTLDFLQPADDPKLLGKLGQHEISEVVGWGGMGVVLKAYDPSLHRVVAVKVLASHLAHHAVARKRFIREAQAAAAVCHDNVVTIHAIEDGVSSSFHQHDALASGRASGEEDRSLDDHSLARRAGFGRSQSLPKIIMQFVAGGSLQERIDQEGPLELKEILRIAMQTAAGLAAAHAQGVVHRDVKPANILLENGVQRVKLTDFGLARVMDDASLTLSGVIAGTPQYMAPEQAWGRDVDARADLFSLGAVMYAMCSGHSPFRARTTMAVLKRVCEDAPRPLRAINPDIPEWLVAIIEKLLAKKPEDRFQSATEVSELLSRWLAHVQQPSVVERPESISARRGSPDPAASTDRRSPGFSRTANSDGDLRSSPGAGSGDPRTAQVAAPSVVTFARVWIPLLVISAVAALVVVEELRLLMVLRDQIGVTRWQFVEPIGIALAHILAAACCYGVFYVGWNTIGGRQRLAMCIVLAAVIWSFVGAIEHLRQPYSFYFWPQVILSGGYLLAIMIRHVSQHGQEMLLLPGVGQAFQSDPNVSNSVDRASGQPGKADRQAEIPLSAKVALLPMLGIGTTVAIILLLIVSAGETNSLPAYLGFAAWNLLATFAICSVFRAAWNTSSWLIWIGAIVLLPAVGCGFLLASSYQPTPAAPELIFAVQSLTAFALLFGLLFVRPFFVRGSERLLRERLTGWQRLFAIACFTIIGTPLALAMMYLLTNSPKKTPVTNTAPARTMVIPIEDFPNRDRPQSNKFPKPQLLSGATGAGVGSSGGMSAGGSTAPIAEISENLKPLFGRWVVVSSEGAALNSAASGMGMRMTSSSAGGAAPSGLDPFGGIGAGGALAGKGPSGAVPALPLQWIEFAVDHAIVFDGRETKLSTDFDLDQEPKRLSLRNTEPLSDEDDRIERNWRYGIYRLERDRLIICWTNNGQPMPTEFAAESSSSVQLLVLRREWNPPSDFDPTKTTPPRAVIPFTADEAKRYQEAWASSTNVPVETTNSVGMKLRLLPPGAFDPTGSDALNKFPMSQIGASFSQPIYIATEEVTIAQFRKFVEVTDYETTAERLTPESGTERRTWHHPGIVQDSDQHPVVRASWQDAQAFCRWLSDTEQQQYRLPTITEWAFAARAGLAASTPLKLPHNARLRFFDTTAPVGSDNANLFGLHDLFGNVSEWANDNLGAVLPKQFTPKRGVPKLFFTTIALGGSYQSSRKRDDGSEWMLPQHLGDTGYQDDVGFRVARIITREVEVLSGFWPPIEELTATAAQVAIPLKSDRAKESDPKTPADDSAKAGQVPRSVVVLRGLVPIGSFPAVPNILDFEIERVSFVPQFFNANTSPESVNAWDKIDLADSLKILDRSDFAIDSVNALLTNPVFTMPLPVRVDSPWPKELVTHPHLPLTPPKTKYDVQQQLFRFIDFDVSPGKPYAYRIRLKFTPAGKQEKPTVLFTPWSDSSNWAKVEELRDEKEH